LSLFADRLLVLPLSTVLFVAGAQQTGKISGQLLTGSGARTGIYTVELAGAATHQTLDRIISNPDGRFEFFSVAPGSYTLVVKTDDGHPIAIQDVPSLVGSGPIEIQIPEVPRVKPVDGTIAANTLGHHPPKKALREMGAAIRAGDSPGALEHLQLAIRIDPDFSEAHTNLGAQYARAGQYEAAYVEFETVLKLGPKGAAQYYNLAVVELAMNRVETAEHDLRRALLIDSRHSLSNYLLGKLLAGQPEHYEEAVRRLKFAAPDVPKANLELARLLSKSNK
jgi:predicted Zn-dependent protease